jgi:DNA-binding MurR/RpiR family transcriptional regulator
MTTETLPRHGIDERVAATEPSLPPAEREVARYFVAHRDEVPFMSAAEIADALDTSGATVVRTAQSLGYRGLPELKRELGSAIRRSRAATTRLTTSLDELGPDAGEVLDHLLDHELGILEETRRSLRREDFARAVDLLLAAERVVVVGPGPVVGLVEQFVQGLRRFGRRASSVTGHGTTLAEALIELGPGDRIVLLAHERLNDEIETVANEARERRLPCILVTDALGLALEGRYSVALTASRGGSTRFPTHAATLVVLEALLLAIAARDRRKVFASVERLNRIRDSLGAL